MKHTLCCETHTHTTRATNKTNGLQYTLWPSHASVITWKIMTLYKCLFFLSLQQLPTSLEHNKHLRAIVFILLINFKIKNATQFYVFKWKFCKIKLTITQNYPNDTRASRYITPGNPLTNCHAYFRILSLIIITAHLVCKSTLFD